MTGIRGDSRLLDLQWAQFLTPAFEVLVEGHPESSLWTFTYPEFWKQFVDKVRQLLRLQVVPYEARHSMPSIDRAEHWRTTEDTRKRGRWMSHKSMLRYEKAGRLAAAARDYPPGVNEHLDLCALHVADVLIQGTLDKVPPPAL